MNKETIHEFCRSSMSDEEGNLNGTNYQIVNDLPNEITVRFFTSEAGTHSPNVFEHYTYNMTFALVAFAEKFAVYCCHPDDDDVRLWSAEDIEDCEGHLFLITDHKGDVNQ